MLDSGAADGASSTYVRAMAGAGAGAMLLLLMAGCPGGATPVPETRAKLAAVGDTVVLGAAGAGEASSGDATYEWSQTAGPPAQLTQTEDGQMAFVPATSGDYEFTLTITAASGAIHVAVVRVSVPDPQQLDALTADAGPDRVLWPGGSAVLSGSAAGGLAPYQYSWLPVEGLDDASMLQPTASPAATTVYTLVVTDSGGSMVADSVEVRVEGPAPLTADAGPDQVIASGGSVDLAGTAGGGTPPYQYEWTPAAGLSDAGSAQPIASPGATTEYTLTVTDSQGARASDAVMVTVATSASGPYWANTTWTTAASPYLVVGDVQIPEGITLTLEPGVEVRYAGSTQIYVKGAIVAVGTSTEKITFRRAGPVDKTYPTFIKFEGANLSESRLDHVAMSHGGHAIRVGSESEFDQRPKNTGTLTVAHAQFDSTVLLTDGYREPGDVSARLILTDCSLVSCTVVGEYPRSEPIEIINSTLTDCEITSESYNRGITLAACTVSGTRLRAGCCGANLVVQDSTLTDCTIMGADSAALRMGRSDCTNVAIDFHGPGSQTDIADCMFRYDSSYSPRLTSYGYAIEEPVSREAKITLGGGTVKYSTFTGNGEGAALELMNGAHYQVLISHCTIEQNEIGVIADPSAEAWSVVRSNLLANRIHAIDNRSTRAVTATDNFWGTGDAGEIPLLIRDYFDDIRLGRVEFEPFVAARIADAGPRP